MDIEVAPASLAEKPILARLLEFYIHDFSEFGGFDVDHQGRYGYRHLENYWTEDTRLPFLIRVDGVLAGFALVSMIGQGDGRETDMSEFFIMRKYRRQGVGRIVATTLFDRFPGQWRVRQILENVPAQRFWRSVIGAYTNGDYAESTTDRHVVQSFRAG